MPERPTFRAHGAQMIETHLEKMLAVAEAVESNEDVEAVHDMRVASRRLRAALSVFGTAFPHGRFARFDADVKAVTTSLGEARDLDVMIETLEALEATVPANERAGIAAFVQEKRQARNRLQKPVVQALRRMEKRDLRGQFERLRERSEPDGSEEPTEGAE
jgi:CHAD domain-containing protein